METEREVSWKIYVTAKAKNFNFRLKFFASTYTPTWTLSFFNLSILLKLHNFVFRISSQPKQEQGFITTKVMKFFHKFRPRFPKIRPSISAKTKSNLSYPKDPIFIGFWLMGFLACLAQFIRNKDYMGIVKLAFVVFFVASLLLKKFKTAKVVNLAAFLLVGLATLFCYMFFDFDYNYYWDYMGRSVWNKIIGNL